MLVGIVSHSSCKLFSAVVADTLWTVRCLTFSIHSAKEKSKNIEKWKKKVVMKRRKKSEVNLLCYCK
jgi:hypothetical protein